MTNLELHPLNGRNPPNQLAGALVHRDLKNLGMSEESSAQIAATIIELDDWDKLPRREAEGSAHLALEDFPRTGFVGPYEEFSLCYDEIDYENGLNFDVREYVAQVVMVRELHALPPELRLTGLRTNFEKSPQHQFSFFAGRLATLIRQGCFTTLEAAELLDVPEPLMHDQVRHYRVESRLRYELARRRRYVAG